MGLVEMIIKKNYFHLMEKGGKHLQEKLEKLADFVKKYLPDYLLDSFTSHDETGFQKLETILFQLMGEEQKEKFTPFDWFFIVAVSFIYSIGMPQRYEGDRAFVENRRIFQVKSREFLEKHYSEMGLKEIEADILKFVGFASVAPKEERDSIKNKMFDSPDASIKAVNIPLLESFFKLAPLLVVEVPCRQTGSSMIESIRIDHPDQKIAIEATYLEPYEKNQLDIFVNHIDEELKSLREVLEKNSIFLNKVTLDARVKEFLPPIEEGRCFGRERATRQIFLLSEKRKIAIVTGSPGVGITTILKYGVKPALRNQGIHVIYCSVDRGFQQSIIRTLDQLFPDTRAENLFTQLEMLSSENHLLVIMLDHFEQIFTIDDSNKLTIEMLNFLKAFEKLESGNNRLILGIKEDFLENLYHFSHELHGFYTEEAFYYLKNFDRMSAGKVMVKTTEQMNFPVDEQLIETMLDDLTQKEDAIYPPLIHIIFNQLFKKHLERFPYRSEKNPLNLNFYNSTGRAAAILVDYTREKLEDFSEEEQNVSIEIIQNMVTPFFTGQRMHHRGIVELNDNRVDIEKLLQRLLRLRFIKRIQTAGGYEYELIHDFLRGLVPKTPTVAGVDDTSSFVREAIAYIDSSYYRPISLQEVAKRVGVTPEHLSRQFKSGFNIGFKEYVTRKRIEEAKQLLLRFPELSINELSERTGFASPQHFINVFKSETQFTPLKFRQRSLTHSDSGGKSGVRSH